MNFGLFFKMTVIAFCCETAKIKSTFRITVLLKDSHSKIWLFLTQKYIFTTEDNEKNE